MKTFGQPFCTVCASGRALIRTGALDRIARAGWRQAGRHGLGGLLRTQAELQPHQIAVKDQRGAVTWAEFEFRVDRLARFLRARLGVNPRGGVLVALENSAGLVEVLTALARLGIPAALASPRSSERRLRELGQASNVAAWIVGRSVAPRPAPAGGTPALVMPIDDAVLPSAIHSPDPLGDRTVGPSLRRLGQLARIPLRCDDRHLVVSAMWRQAAADLVRLTLALGGTVVIEPRDARALDPERFLAAIEEHRITTTAAPLTLLRGVAALPETALARYDTSSLHAVFCIDGALPSALATRAMHAFGYVLYRLSGDQLATVSSHSRR